MNDLPTYLSIKEAENDGLATPSLLGKLLDRDRRQVYTWASRRDRNGFPRQRATYVAGARMYPLYDVNEFMTWFRSYAPSTNTGPIPLVDTVHGT